MANTNQLKYVVESELKRMFCVKHGCKIIKLSNQQLQQVFNGTEPDLVAIDISKGILHVGEVTTSGFMGQIKKRRDFHVEAVKKIFEAFSKFYLLLMDKDGVVQRLSKYHNIEEINNIECHFIVPEGAKFINALGYRAKLFETGIMKLETVKLTSNCEQLMLQILMNSSEENKKVKSV